ncbi:hypothetical protein OIU74_005294 [Salix koriyanagi]|uniref:Uncharacterized protein n=1 Tax=Salix koriyanagi TaxID=2511006 RepID=A0A9Q0UNL3_9ROSI|nr:hypothetical protein OIU74_005294 [Salix koriyanagi]
MRIGQKNSGWKRHRSIIGSTLDIENRSNQVVYLDILKRWHFSPPCKLRTMADENCPHGEKCIVITMCSAALLPLSSLLLHRITLINHPYYRWNPGTCCIMKPTRQLLLEIHLQVLSILNLP